jgi:hypothetical protein
MKTYFYLVHHLTLPPPSERTSQTMTLLNNSDPLTFNTMSAE